VSILGRKTEGVRKERDRGGQVNSFKKKRAGLEIQSKGNETGRGKGVKKRGGEGSGPAFF